MQESPRDPNRDLILDGNAAGGILMQVFGSEMTTTPAECANCGNVAKMGALLAFTQAPGLVLRCPACENVVLRIVETPQAICLDARGAAYLRLARGEA